MKTANQRVNSWLFRAGQEDQVETASCVSHGSCSREANIAWDKDHDQRYLGSTNQKKMGKARR